ncbi:MAG: hypothetical protein II220_03230 [Spirochaetales bacterium]|nr:hypothetical protein [Spirochaetales bacterium]
MIRTFFCTLLIFIIFPIFPKATANLIHSSYLYKTAQTDNELSPFSGKTPLICLNKGSKVKILDEFETSAMHGNILFVEIADGKTGYIEKSSVIPEEYADIKFFTNIQIKDLPKNSTLSFLYSGMDGLHFEDKNKKTFILENLENVRFILNRKAENRYRYNNGCIIVKAIDMQTLRPLTNAKLNNIKIESDGYCYLDKKDVGKDFLLECDGYESKKVTVNKKINLFFLSAFHSIKEENNADNKNICTVKINSISEISQIYFRKENSFVMHSADSQEISLSKGKYEIIYETVEGGFYPLQQFINLRNDSANTSDILKNANRDRSNSSWREVPQATENNAIWKILFLKGKNLLQRFFTSVFVCFTWAVYDRGVPRRKTQRSKQKKGTDQNEKHKDKTAGYAAGCRLHRDWHLHLVADRKPAFRCGHHRCDHRVHAACRRVQPVYRLCLPSHGAGLGVYAQPL